MIHEYTNIKFHSGIQLAKQDLTSRGVSFSVIFPGFNGTSSSISQSQLQELGIAQKAATLIELLGGEHMFHPPAKVLQQYFDVGLACALTDTYSHDPIAFIKADPWVIYPDGKVAIASDNPTLVFGDIEKGTAQIAGFETGSLVVDPAYQNKGLGSFLKNRMAHTAVVQYPGHPVFCVVTNDNVPSIHNNHKLGWSVISPAESMQLLGGVNVLEGWTPPSTIFMYPPSLDPSNMLHNTHGASLYAGGSR